MKKLLTFALILALCAALLCASAAADDEPFAGSGTEADPYQISSAEDMFALEDRVNIDHETYEREYFILTQDIDLETSDGDEWVPIGNTTSRNPERSQFLGSFDGQGHTISGLHVSDKYGYAGLFGVVGLSGEETEAEVKNLHVEGDVSATMDEENSAFYVGGITGFAGMGVEITDCSFSGTVKAESKVNAAAHAGGVVGYARVATISGCEVVDITETDASKISASSLRSGEVKYAEAYAGGIAGENNGCEVTDSSFSGSVSANGTDETDVGGIVGRNINGTISNCYTVASGADESKISAEPSCTHLRIGGIAGYNSGTISGCTNSLAVSSGGDTVNTYIGGIAGSGGTISNCTNSGKVKSVSPEGGMQIYTGGIAGSGSKISNCSNTAEVSSSGGGEGPSKEGTGTGGVVGFSSSGGRIERCFNTGPSA